jgi:hypothetical protein
MLEYKGYKIDGSSIQCTSRDVSRLERSLGPVATIDHRTRANRRQDIQDDEGSGSACIRTGKRVSGQKTVRTLGPLQAAGSAFPEVNPVNDAK